MKCPKCQTDNASDSRFCKECATALPATSQPGVMGTETLDTRPTELTTGSSFAGRYQIIEELGHGGMGRVFRALDTKLREEVALKLIRPEIALDRNTLERFQNELKLARKISHRNVGRMYELMDDRGAHFITMEYVPGEDLRSFILRSGQLTVGKTLSIARQISEGLDEAHRQGIIHRDLKPSNIIIDREGNAKIMDFGIARSLAAKSQTGAGVMIGTPEYMSPEQVEGWEVDARSDLYSLGIIIYEMLTGRVPFEGDTPFSIGIKQKSERPKEPRDFNASIPDDLNRLILKCLEKDKAARPQSAAEVRAELARIEHGLPTTERVAPSRKPLTSREITVKFTPKKLALPVAVFVMIAAVVAWRILAPKRAAPLSGKPSLAIAYFENISGDPALDDWKTGVPELLTTDLAQSKFLTVLSGDTVYGLLKKLGLLDAKKYSADDLVKVADEGRVHYVLTGGIMKAGPKIIITARLQKPRTGEVVETKKIECEGEEDIPRRVDELTRMVKADLNLTPQQIAGDIDKDVGRISTSSPEALKYYVEARKLHMEMKYDPAISLYERAIALDPGFAMAYRGMATCYGNKGFLQKAREFNQKAMDHTDRISDRERLSIQGRAYHLSERTCGKAIQTYEELIKLYPDDSLGLNGLGLVYSAIEESEKALAYFERDYALDKDALSCANVAGELESLGRYDEARGVYEEYLRSVADSAGIRRGMGWNALAQGHYEEARREADKAFLLSPNDIQTSNLKSDIEYLSGHFDAAEKELRAVIEKNPPATTMFARARLIALFWTQGRFKLAKEELESASVLADQLKIANMKASAMFYGAVLDVNMGHPDQALEKLELSLKISKDLEMSEMIRLTMTWQGIISLEAGRPEQAAKVAAELKDFIEKSLNRKAVRYANLLDGYIELKKGNYPKAIGFFEKAVSLLPFQTAIGDEHALFLEPLAFAYEKSGNLMKAREEFEKITALTIGRPIVGDIYAKAFYRLGKIAEQQGDKARARENYGKFLDLWKNADPGILEVEDARKRLAGL